MDDRPPSNSVSVIVPCYNNARTIERCLASVLGQTRPPLEILVYDDASSDASLSILASIESREPTVRVFAGPENQGAGHARRFLLERCAGDLVAFLDADDHWQPPKLERQLAAMRDETVGLCITDAELRDATGNRLGARVTRRPVTYRTMLLSNWICTSTVVMRLGLVHARDMPPIRKRQDYAHWLKVLRDNPGMKVARIDEPLVVIERRRDSISANKLDNVRYNYRVFRQALGFGAPAAAFFVACNALVRLFRS